MDYFDINRSYWQKHKDAHFTGNETLLYMRLVALFNGKGVKEDWPESMRFMDTTLCEETGLSRNTMVKVRAVLIRRNLIGFQEVGKGYRSGGEYQLLCENETPKRTSKNEHLSQKRTSNSDVLTQKRTSEFEQVDELRTSEFDVLSAKERQKDNQNLTFSHIYIESKPTKPFFRNNRERENVGEGEILAEEILVVEAEEIKHDFDKKNNPQTPGCAAPLSPALDDADTDDADADEAERIDFTTRLKNDRRLIEGLHRLYKLPPADAQHWIEQYVLTQWTNRNLQGRNLKDLITHCQKWVQIQLEKPASHANHNPANHNRRNRPTESAAQTGSNLDRIVEEYYARRGY